MDLTYLNNTTTSILGYIYEYTSFSNLKTINSNVSGNSIFNNNVILLSSLNVSGFTTSRSGLVSEARTDRAILYIITTASPARWLGPGAQHCRSKTRWWPSAGSDGRDASAGCDGVGRSAPLPGSHTPAPAGRSFLEMNKGASVGPLLIHPSFRAASSDPVRDGPLERGSLTLKRGSRCVAAAHSQTAELVLCSGSLSNG